jgi:hypothetical protein
MSSNFRPFLALVDRDLKTTTLVDRLRRPIVTVRGIYPVCQWDSAVPDDGLPRTAHADALHLYFEDASIAEREMRLKMLFEKCPALRREVNRRSNAASQPRHVPDRRSDVERVFGA